MDVPAGVTQEEGHTGFLIHLPSAVRALIFVVQYQNYYHRKYSILVFYISFAIY